MEHSEYMCLVWFNKNFMEHHIRMIYIYMINIEYGLFSHDQTGQQAVLELGHPYPFLLEPSLAPGPWKAVRFSHGAHHRRDGGATLGVQLHHCRTGNLR